MVMNKCKQSCCLSNPCCTAVHRELVQVTAWRKVPEELGIGVIIFCNGLQSLGVMVTDWPLLQAQ